MATIVTTIKSRSKSGSSKKGRQHVAHVQKYQKQKWKTAKNKAKAWTRHLEKHPKDLTAKKEIKRLMDVI